LVLKNDLRTIEVSKLEKLDNIEAQQKKIDILIKGSVYRSKSTPIAYHAIMHPSFSS